MNKFGTQGAVTSTSRTQNFQNGSAVPENQTMQTQFPAPSSVSKTSVLLANSVSTNGMSAQYARTKWLGLPTLGSSDLTNNAELQLRVMNPEANLSDNGGKNVSSS